MLEEQHACVLNLRRRLASSAGGVEAVVQRERMVQIAEEVRSLRIFQHLRLAGARRTEGEQGVEVNLEAASVRDQLGHRLVLLFSALVAVEEQALSSEQVERRQARTQIERQAAGAVVLSILPIH